MKIVYQNVLWIVFFAAYNYLSLAANQGIELDVAAFFDDANNHQAKIAFNTAIDNFNRMDKTVSFRGVPIDVAEWDNFETSNILCNLTESVLLGGVICPTSPKITPIVESICINLEIPAMQLHWRPSAEMIDNSSAVNFFPDSRLFFQGLGVIVKNLQWRTVVIFYESTENLIRLQDVLKIQSYDSSNKYNSVIVKELGPGPDFRGALKQIQNKSEHRIIIDCKTENILPILRQARDLKLMEKQFNYFITSLDAHTVDIASLNVSANITTIRIINPDGIYFQNALSRWNIYAQEQDIRNANLDPFLIKTETALMYDAVNNYVKAVRDIIVKGVDIRPTQLSCNENTKPWKDSLLISNFLKSRKYQSENLYSITGPMTFDTFGRRTNFTLYVVQGGRGGDAVATWNPNNSNLKFLKSEEDRNKELERKWSQGTVTVASILGPPYLMEKKRVEGEEPLTGNARYEGFSVDLMKALAEELNIKIHFEILKEGQRGSYDKKKKSWNGLVGEILEGRAELAICDLTITPERREVVDFSTPFMRLGISILYKKPEPKKTNMYAFLDPLDFDLWMYTATIYLAQTVVLYFIARLSPADWENPHPCDPEPEELENIWDMKNCLWLTLGSIMNQGCDILPKGLASRLVASMWWFYSIIVTNSYMANLAAFLTNERNQNEINNAEELAMQTKVKYGTMEGGSTQAFFRDSNYSLYQRMWTSMQQFKPTVFEKSNDAGVARVQTAKNRGYAFLMESATLEYQLSTKCDLMQVGNWLDSKSYGIAMPLDYPHRSRINEALLGLLESGTINKLKDKWWTSKICEKETEPDSAKLALQNVGGVFIVLAVGIALAYIVAICEFLWNVRNVSVEEHISFMQALKIELKFALNITVTKKRVKRQASESSRRTSESRSLARSILHGAGSFLRLDVMPKNETPGSSRHSSRPLD